MIYASLGTIQRWHNAWVLPNYLALALMTGAVWLSALAHGFGLASAATDALGPATVAVAWALKAGYWRFIDRTAGPGTPESATGLEGLGPVRLIDPPHTRPNFVQREMGYRLARRHAARLRRLAALTAFALPFGLGLVAAFAPAVPALVPAVLAALSASLGVLIERWLFFAEARHSVTLYYAAARA